MDEVVIILPYDDVEYSGHRNGQESAKKAADRIADQDCHHRFERVDPYCYSEQARPDDVGDQLLENDVPDEKEDRGKQRHKEEGDGDRRNKGYQRAYDRY